MISVIINSLAVIFGLFCSTQNSKKHLSIIVFYFVLSRWFGLAGRIVGGEMMIKEYDFCLVYILLLSVLHSRTIKNENGGLYGKFIKVFLWTHCALFVMTVAMDYESLRMSIQNTRFILLYAAFFPMLIFRLRDFEKAFKIIFVVEILLGINFLLQYAGIFVLTSYEEIKMTNGVARFLNVPAWFLFYLIFLSITKTKIHRKPLLLLLFGALLILPMSRMRIFFFVAVMLLYLLILRRDLKRFVKIGLAFGLLALFLSPYLLARVNSSDGHVSMSEDIRFALTNRNYQNYNTDDAGTLGFRISMLAERVDYLIDHPQYALTGVGFRHEESPYCYRNFNFYLGTYNERYAHFKGELQSSDNNWIFIVMQMGLIGVFLYLSLMYIVCRKMFINRENDIMMTGFLYMLLFALGSITEAVWTANRLFIILVSLLMAYTVLYEKEKGKITCNRDTSI